MADLNVAYRPIRTEAEQAAFEAALDTLVVMALSALQDERDNQAGVNIGKPEPKEIPVIFQD